MNLAISFKLNILYLNLILFENKEEVSVQFGILHPTFQKEKKEGNQIFGYILNNSLEYDDIDYNFLLNLRIFIKSFKLCFNIL